MKRLASIALVLTALAAGQTRLPDGVLRYDRPERYSIWQYVQENWGWIIKARPFGRSVAFLVGVGDYATIRPKLSYVGSDLAELREFLLTQAHFDTVYVAEDKVATADLVERYMFTELPRVLSAEDRLLFYFSGHGADVSGTGYMQFGNAGSEYDRSQYLEVTRAEQWSKRLPVKHVLFIIDACNSGLGYDAKVGNEPTVDQELLIQFSGDGSRNVLTAGTGNEKSFQVTEGNRQGYSVFTRAFLDSIRQTHSDGGFLTLTEVLAGVERRVAAFSRGNPGRQMTPRKWQIPRQPGKDKGTFVFLNPNAKKPSVPASLTKYVSVVTKGSDIDPAALANEKLLSQQALSIASGIGNERGRFAPAEVSLLWQLASADDPIRLRTLREILSHANLTGNFNRRSGFVVQAAVGISPLRDVVIEELLLPKLDDSRPLPVRIALMHLGANLQVEDERFNRWALTVIKQALKQSKDEAERVDIVSSVAHLAPQFSGDIATGAFGTLLPFIAKRSSLESAPYIGALQALSRRLDVQQVATARQQISTVLGALDEEQDPTPFVKLACALPSPLNDAQTRSLLDHLSNRWQAMAGSFDANRGVGEAILELVRHAPSDARWMFLERLPKIADAGRSGWSRTLLGPPFEIVSQACTGQDGTRTTDILFHVLQRARDRDHIMFVASGLRACARTLSSVLAQELANQIADFIIAEFKRAGDPVDYHDFKGTGTNPFYVLPAWLDALATLRCTLDSDRATAIFSKAKAESRLDVAERKELMPPLVAAISLMDPKTAHATMGTVLQMAVPLRVSANGEKSESLSLSTLGDIAQALSLQASRVGWQDSVGEGRWLVDRIIETALNHGSSPDGHQEARVGAAAIVASFAPEQSLKLRDRLFQRLLKEDPASYDAATLAQIAASLPNKFTAEQVSALSRAWDLHDFKEAWRFEPLKSLPGKLPADIGRKWLHRFVDQCDDSSEAFYTGLLSASQVLAPRIDAAEARRVLLIAMADDRSVEAEVVLARAFAATAEPLPGVGAAEAISKLMQRWMARRDLREPALEMLAEAVNAIVRNTAVGERALVVEELFANLAQATDSTLQGYLTSAIQTAIAGSDEGSAPALFDWLVLKMASERNPVIHRALASSIAAIPGKVPISAIAEFLKSPFCSGPMREAATGLIARLGGPGPEPRLPTVTTWLKEQGIDVGSPAKTPAFSR